MLGFILDRLQVRLIVISLADTKGHHAEISGGQSPQQQ